MVMILTHITAHRKDANSSKPNASIFYLHFERKSQIETTPKNTVNYTK